MITKMNNSLEEIAKKAKKAGRSISRLNGNERNELLALIVNNIIKNKDVITLANSKDMDESTSEGLAPALLKRLKYDESKIEETIASIQSLIRLKDPLGITLEKRLLDDSLTLQRDTCPIGLIGIIFESRPDALVQISTLCLKSGNAVLLKGGKEALNTNRELYNVIKQSTIDYGVNADWIQLLETRDEVNEMLKLDHLIDLIIPRGSNEFVRYIMDNSHIPVLGHADGICHAYIDESANISKAIEVVFDSKCQYVAVCNALETLLVHKNIASRILPLMQERLATANVELRGCAETIKIINCKAATNDDWKTEYLDYILSIKIVDSMEAAIDHINEYGSGHTETIITEDKAKVLEFMDSVDSGNVFHNCSTRFSDGYRYGLGAEVGVSTQKLHARGPVGLNGLLSYKWKCFGDGQVVADYSKGVRKFKHIDLL